MASVRRNVKVFKLDVPWIAKEVYINQAIPGGYCDLESLKKTLPFNQETLIYNANFSDRIDLNFNYFNYVGEILKFPLMRNKRKRDPLIKEYCIKNNVKIKTDYGLPTMNLKASYSSLNKYAKPEVTWDESAAAFAYEAMFQHFHPYMKEAEILSYEEALSAVDTTTSPGFPWNKDFRTKRDLISHPRMAEFETYTNLWDYLKDNPDYWFVFTNSLKEEIRPEEKIRLNKIRTFTASPFEAVVNGIRLFGDMNEKFYDSHLKTASAVGLNPFEGGWHELYCKLKNHPKVRDGKVFAYELDESEFDSSLRSFLFDNIVKFRIACLKPSLRTPENIARIKNYYRNIVNSVIITADGKIVQKFLGNPSGSVNTISDNTLILYFLLAYAWYVLSPVGQKTISDFWVSVVMALQGDDNTWTVDRETNLFYNAKSVSEVFSVLGVTTTSPCYDPRPLEDVSFLSSDFKCFVGTICIYNLDPDKILESMKWTEYPNDAIMTLTRVSGILRVLWPHKQARELCRGIADYLIKEYDSVFLSVKDWLDVKASIWSDFRYLYFYVGEAGALNNVSHIKEVMNDLIVVPESCILHAKKGKKNMKEKVTVTVRPLKKPKKNKKKNKQKKKNGKRIVTAPVSRGLVQTMKPPLIRKGGKSVVFREFISDITGSTTFSLTTFPLNPGLFSTFPWLSGQAPLYETYRFKRLSFEFESSQSSSKIGVVIMSTDYDAAEPAPINKQQIMDYMGASRGQSWTNFIHHCSIPAMNAYRKRYVRVGTLPANQDIKTFDSGNFYIATIGQDNTDQIGELYVNYEVEFYTPQLNGPNQLLGGRVIASAASMVNTNLLGTTATLDGSASGINVDAAGIVTFLANAQVQATLNIVGTGLTTIDLPAGWTASSNSASTTATTRVFIKYVIRGETLGPLTMPSATTLTSGLLLLSVAPIGSLTVTEEKRLETDRLNEASNLRKRVADLEKLLKGLVLKTPESRGFVKLPRLDDKVVCHESEEDS